MKSKIYKKIRQLLILILLFTFLNSCKTHKTNKIEKIKNIGNKTEEIANSEKNKNSLILNTLTEKTGVVLDGSENILLYKTISEWMGTPHKLGGYNKTGIDCSAFVIEVFAQVYGYNLNRSSYEMLNNVDTINKQNLKEGDLIFFKTYKNRVSHVGIYLKNNKFVHASSSKGVIISDLNEEYWLINYYLAGRVKKQ